MSSFKNYCFAARDVSCERMENGGQRSHQKSTGQGHSGPRCKVSLSDDDEICERGFLFNQITVLEKGNRNLKKENAQFRTSISTSIGTEHPKQTDIGGRIMVSEAALRYIDHSHHRKLTNGRPSDAVVLKRGAGREQPQWKEV